MQLEFNKEYTIAKIEDLNKFQIDSKVKEYLILEINNLLNDKLCKQITISLQGSEHNKQVMEKTYEDLDKEHIKQILFIEQLYKNNKISLEDMLSRKEKLVKLQKESIDTVKHVLNIYQEWFDKYNNYDVIVINKYE